MSENLQVPNTLWGILENLKGERVTIILQAGKKNW